MTRVAGRGIAGWSAVTLLACAGLPGQDGQVRRLLQTELQRLFGGQPQSFVCEVSGSDGGHGVPDLHAGNPFANPGVRFAGTLDIVSTETCLVVASRQQLPAFAMHRGSEGWVTFTVRRNLPIDLVHVETDLRRLLDVTAVQRAIAAASLVARPGPTDGRTTVSTRFPATLVADAPAEHDPLVAMRPKVLHVDASFVLTADGRLEQWYFKVVRSDPLQTMTRQIASGQVQPQEVDAQKFLQDVQTVAGMVREYRLVPTGTVTPGPDSDSESMLWEAVDRFTHQWLGRVGFSVFGSGCAGSSGEPEIALSDTRASADGTFQVGVRFTQVDTVATLFVGMADATGRAVGGCTSYVRRPWVEVHSSTGAAGRSTVTIAFPAAACLLGLEFAGQFAVADPVGQWDSLQGRLALSNAIRFRLGR